jgi:hypothetical protein
MHNLNKISHFFKIAFFLSIIYFTGCGQQDPTDWYSYRTNDRHAVSIKVNSAEILPGTEKKDLIKIKMTWRNDDSENIVIDNEYFSLSVSGVKLNPESFQNVELAPGQALDAEYDFLVLSSFVDKAKYKLSLEDYAEFPVIPMRK